MGHELDFANGTALCFSTRQTPWHREGIVLTDAPDFDTAEKLAGHDYPVEKQPYWLPTAETLGSETPQFVKGDGAYYTFRPDTKKVLGNVGADYQVVTNKESFAILRPLVDQGLLKLETGGTLRHGADAWLMGAWDMTQFGPVVQEVMGGEVLPYCTVMANHSGRRGILLGNTAIRVVCANTLGAAEREIDGQRARHWRSVVHTNGAGQRLVEAAEDLFGKIVQEYEVIAKQYRLLKESYMDFSSFRKLVLDVVAPDPVDNPKWNPEAKMAGVVRERAMQKRAVVTQLWTGGAGHTGEKTAYYAYQAAVEALDHNRDLWPTRAGCFRTASLLTGQLAMMKNTVLDNLVQFAMAC